MNKFSFKKYQPVGLRFWHWLNAAVIISLLLTVLLRKTLLSWRTNSVVIQQKLTDAGSMITTDLAKEIAITIRNPLWDWHIYLGYALTALLIGRLLVALFIEKKFVDSQHIKNLFSINSFPEAERKQALHFSLVKTGYAVFYIATLMMVLTGLLLVFKGSLNISKSVTEIFKETHELMMWFFIVFAGAHIIGVVVAEKNGSSGIVSDMINGGNAK